MNHNEFVARLERLGFRPLHRRDSELPSAYVDPTTGTVVHVPATVGDGELSQPQVEAALAEVAISWPEFLAL